jgi:hypothetical protein
MQKKHTGFEIIFFYMLKVITSQTLRIDGKFLLIVFQKTGTNYEL